MPPRDTVIDGVLCYYSLAGWIPYPKTELTRKLIRAEAPNRFDVSLTYEEFIKEISDRKTNNLRTRFVFNVQDKDYELIDLLKGGTLTMGDDDITFPMEIGNIKTLIEIGNLTIRRKINE